MLPARSIGRNFMGNLPPPSEPANLSCLTAGFSAAFGRMIVKPKVRGFVCVTAHPEGCAAHVAEQIRYVQDQPPVAGGPKRVLVIGASTGYGLSSRITAAFGCGASTIGVFFERPSDKGRPASAGWYNTVAFEREAAAAGLYAKSLNGDAFGNDMKDAVCRMISEDLGQVDMVIYSLASPRRTDPVDGSVYRSALKPIGKAFANKSVDTDQELVTEVTIEPASEEEIFGTRKVMGGEDWELWMAALQSAGVLAPGVKTLAYSYIGPEVTFPIYHEGTIGQAKADLDRSVTNLNAMLADIKGRAWVSVNKAVVTQASSAIPVVPLYISILFKIMKEKGTHEGCIEQIYRLFAANLYSGADVATDEDGRIRVDDLEMDPSIQESVKDIWPRITTENLRELSDFAGYQEEFLKLFGFEWPEVDYSADVEVDVPIPSMKS